MSACKQMKSAILKVIKSVGKLAEFESGEFHVKVKPESYMALHIERHGDRVMVAHYFEQNGDLVPDPDIEFWIGPDGEWYAVAMQNALGSYFKALVFADGKPVSHYPRTAKDISSFSNLWARNINSQGYADKHGVAVAV